MTEREIKGDEGLKFGAKREVQGDEGLKFGVTEEVRFRVRVMEVEVQGDEGKV